MRIFIASLLPITIPGSIIGMLILFVLLALQICRAVGQPRLQYPDPLYGAAVRADRRWGHAVLGFAARPVRPVVISCAISTLVVFVVVSWSSHWCMANVK
jgi:holin-like protein